MNYSVEIRELVKIKRKTRRRWQQTKDPSDKTIINNKTQTLRRKIQNLKEKTINSYLQNLSVDEKNGYLLWKAIKTVRRPIISIHQEGYRSMGQGQ